MKEIVIVGWKGKSELEIYNDEEDVIIKEYRKNKETRDVAKQVTIIPYKNVRLMLYILRENAELGDVYGYRWIARKVMQHYGFDVDMDAWNGGHNRSKYYFPYHYYPLKVLEAEGHIKYFGRGSIQRLI